jgi:hypothetical protein
LLVCGKYIPVLGVGRLLTFFFHNCMFRFSKILSLRTETVLTFILFFHTLSGFFFF